MDSRSLLDSRSAEVRGRPQLFTSSMPSQVTIAFRGDTRNVSMETAPGTAVYRNDQGEATVTLIQGASKSVAHIAAGQIYVRYDTKNGTVGFGSFATGPTYPITLVCDEFSGEDCTSVGKPQQDFVPYNELVAALADIKGTGDASRYSADVSALLPTGLTDSTLLTGVVSACAVAYNLTDACPSSPATPIRTDLGDFYLQDQNFGSGGIFTVVVGEKEED